ncbi:hypothetical protein [Cerasicoccus arenae]|uniref:Uncharacterized protein n=1 Tax=Cerasicoccus arenae TaxID=424488 RepID=A0A8J3DBX0_9BACT|nr:hypothetical protein [Cerasicoccus arenae]MBK1857316.1 hypothetical protein [Cerasicoccus arenae]GHC00653.1 hypothetical protein GCM10007047_16360 [Cerasicoccus arenae]
MPPRMHQIWLTLLLVVVVGTSHAQSVPEGIRLRGANGAEIVAAGVLEAHPQGAVLLLPGQMTPILAPWDKFDLEQLRGDQPTIYYGYLDATRFNRPFLLKLGVYENIVSFEESIQLLNRELVKPRFYPLPENVNYLIEQDPDVMRWKERDFGRYNKLMRDYRQELQDFLRRIFPSESIIIDDTGALHHKDRADSVDPIRGETSLSLIFSTLADTKRTPSRLGLAYLRQVTTLQTDVDQQWDDLRSKIPNDAFRDGNLNHMKLPNLMDESRLSLERMLTDTHLHQANQQKLSDFTSFVYSNYPNYRLQ